MKLYPYSKIKTDNLKLLLITARVMGILGILLLLASIFFAGAIPFLGPETKTRDIGGAVMSYTTQGYVDMAIIGSLWAFVSGLTLLAISGACAALVSFEYRYTSDKGTHSSS